MSDLANVDEKMLDEEELSGDEYEEFDTKDGVLDLSSNNLGVAEAVALSSWIVGNVSLKEINLACNRGIGQAGWQAIFDALSIPSCRLEKLTLEYNEINDAAAQSLSNALISNTTIKTLNLSFIMGITPTGWRVLFGALRSPTCALEDLDLSYNEHGNDFNDEMMTSLTDALASNMSLKSLDLFSNNHVTGATWQRFFSIVLANPSSGLEKVKLGYNLINDAAIRVLTSALVNNSKLKVLDLSDNNISDADCEMFSSVLESPITALEELDLQRNAISNASCTALLNSLTNNKKLKKLAFYHSDDWEPPMSVLCNTISIIDTLNSNHTLEKLEQYDSAVDLPVEFESLLQINRENSPNQAARVKIIKTHFKGGFVTQPFVGMNLNVLPRAMAWMSRDGRVGEVDGHFYSFIKSRSSLFEKVDRKNNKRKRY